MSAGFRVYRVVALIMVIAVGGCDQLFNIHRIDPSSPGDAGNLDDGGRQLDAVLDDGPINCGSHDEDSDGIHDKCDSCPTIASSDPTDSDNDGAPDVCDPSPNLIGNSIDAFYSFENANGWTGGGTFAMDALTIAPSQSPVTTKVFTNPVEIVTQLSGLFGVNTNFQIVFGTTTATKLLCQVGTFCANNGVSCIAIYAGGPQVAAMNLSIPPDQITAVILWRDNAGIVKCSVNDRTAAHTVSYTAATTMPTAPIGLLAPTATFTANSLIVYRGP